MEVQYEGGVVGEGWQAMCLAVYLHMEIGQLVETSNQIGGVYGGWR